MRHPKQVEALSSKKVVDLAVGSMHCLAITEDGEVYSWGRNDLGQQADSAVSSKSKPTLISVLESKHIIGAACGQAQVGETVLLPLS